MPKEKKLLDQLREKIIQKGYKKCTYLWFAVISNLFKKYPRTFRA